MLFFVLGLLGVSLNVLLVSCRSGASPADPAHSAASRIPADPTRAVDRSFSVRSVMHEPTVRVRISQSTHRVEIAGASKNDRLIVEDARGSAVRLPRAVVSRDAGGWLISADGSSLHAHLQVLRIGSETGRRVRLAGDEYPGAVLLRPRSDLGSDRFDVIIELPLEDYVQGVVAKEMYPDWDYQAFCVQAICARTYALHQRQRAINNGRFFDLENTQLDQVYAGGTSNTKIKRAVNTTRGIVIAEGDTLVRAYYSSTCGGRPAGAADIWPTGRGFEFNNAPALRASARDAHCTHTRHGSWEVTVPRSEAMRRIRAFGEREGLLVRHLRDLHSIEPWEHNHAGRPVSYKVIEPSGRWFELSGEQLRTALNERTPGDPERPFDQIVRSGDLRVLSKTSVRTVTTSSRADDTIVIRGRGFGHGVGMCQFCAQHMARRGDDWAEITRRFYPGARLVRAYD